MRTRIINISLSLILLLLMMASCSSESESSKANKEDTHLTISAAASLKDALEEIKSMYELEYPNVKITYNFGGSGSLKQQISQGAPVDVFFSAAADKLTDLVEANLIAKEDVVSFIYNELVLIVPVDSPYSISTLHDLVQHDIDYISIGIPETVPAGKYTKESLINQDLWNHLESKIVYAKDVRQVLSYVETGNVAAGMVYQTDALLSDKVMVISNIDSELHTPIRYPVGIIKDTTNYEAANHFINYLQNEKSIEVFEQYGFITK